MYAFTYHPPKSLREAASLLAKNEDAKFLAGGHSVRCPLRGSDPDIDVKDR